ncbi:DUF2849 domain-containing protein [Phaeovulum vinaykumarii]|uniref:DUF2849 domain-containing protein n=1 Tax=Phaeovulum vinaykumarii TaxID=407234 RepID=A0A1N7LME5_9RHOB|nr:DUF2849 domain-containing protein [Phaeovulum vinaykumarii]SIS74964.1 Protein of unknown function [Phaeovulum vinaykumarii]SOC05393.1 uncharacterized protein DUF2849 [Phaeovulum vinaykumarii]
MSRPARRFTPALLGANCLLSGRVLWRTAQGWTEEARAAHLFEDATEAQAALTAAEAEVLRLVGPELVPADPGPDGPVPRPLRGRIRAGGPTLALPGAPFPSGAPFPETGPDAGPLPAPPDPAP